MQPAVFFGLLASTYLVLHPRVLAGVAVVYLLLLVWSNR